MRKRNKNDNEEDNGFLLLLLFLSILYIVVFNLLEHYLIIPKYKSTKQNYLLLTPHKKKIPQKDTNATVYPMDINIDFSTYVESNLTIENFIASKGNNFYKSIMLNPKQIPNLEDFNISLSDIIFEANRYTVFLIVYQAEQLIKAYKLYNLKRERAPYKIKNLVDERILYAIPEQNELVTSTGWKISDNTDVGIDNVAFIINLDGLADNAMKLDFCNLINFYANNQWSLQSTESDIISLGSGKNILENGYASENDAFFCYSTGTNGEYKFQLVFAKWKKR